VIAPKAMPQPKSQPRVRVRARDAALRRGRRTRLQGYAMPARIVVAFTVVLVPVMIYVLLMGNLTALNYSLEQATQKKSALVAETMRLDDRIAQLQSRERLADLAARLHMHDPHVYAVVDVPGPVVAPPSNGIAFLGAFFHR
jgi:cytochrome c-type biogenesis protein CcmH/NrfG